MSPGGRSSASQALRVFLGPVSACGANGDVPLTRGGTPSARRQPRARDSEDVSSTPWQPGADFRVCFFGSMVFMIDHAFKLSRLSGGKALKYAPGALQDSKTGRTRRACLCRARGSAPARALGRRQPHAPCLIRLLCARGPTHSCTRCGGGAHQAWTSESTMRRHVPFERHAQRHGPRPARPSVAWMRGERSPRAAHAPARPPHLLHVGSQRLEVRRERLELRPHAARRRRHRGARRAVRRQQTPPGRGGGGRSTAGPEHALALTTL